MIGLYQLLIVLVSWVAPAPAFFASSTMRSPLLPRHWTLAAHHLTVDTAYYYERRSSAAGHRRTPPSQIIGAARLSPITAKGSSAAGGGGAAAGGYDFGQVRQSAETRMQKTVDHLMQRFGAIRAGQASVSMLDRVEVAWCGSRVGLNKAAHVSQASSQELVVRPFDPKMVGDVAAAITADDAKLSVIPDGEKVRVIIPPLSKERREDLLKQVRLLGEEARVSLRNVRRDAVDLVRDAEKRSASTGLGKDLSRSQQEDIQKLLDAVMKKLDTAVASKEKGLAEGK